MEHPGQLGRKRAGYRPTLPLLGIMLVLLAGSARAELIGAEKLLGQLKENLPAKVEPEKPAGPGKALEKQLEQFGKQVDGLAPDEAVRQWLAFYDSFWALPEDQRALRRIESYEARRMEQAGIKKPAPLALSRVFGVLPGPAAWPALERAVLERGAKNPPDSHRELPLRFMTFMLRGRRDLLLKDLEGLKPRAERLEGYEKTNFLQGLRELEFTLPGSDRAKKTVPERFSLLLEIQEKIQNQNHGGSGVIKIPDLVRLVGEAKAAELIRRALKLPRVQLTVPEGGVTLKLAQRLTLEQGAALKNPQWGLVASIDDVGFFEALRKQFPEKRPETDALKQRLESGEFATMVEDHPGREDDLSENESRNEVYDKARCYALLGLVRQGRMDEATSLTLKLGEGYSFNSSFGEVWQMSDQAALAPGVFTLLGRVLTQKPEISAWDVYVALGMMVGQVDGMLATVSKAAERKDLKPETHTGMIKQFVQALLATDRINQAVTLIRQNLQNKGEHEAIKMRLALRQLRMDSAMILTRLGRLLKRPEWLAEGTQTMRAIAAEPEESEDPAGASISWRYEWGSSLESLVEILIKAQSYELAENILLDVMKQALKKINLSGQDAALAQMMGNSETQELRFNLAQLAQVYQKAKRPKDIMVLLTQAPWWGVADLKKVLGNDYRLRNLEPGRSAAEALADAGRTSEAVTLLKSGLYSRPENDKNYELLVQLEGIKLIPWLDELYQRNRFEERPLIWKAWLLSKANRLEEAEKIARQAIAVDPTDGEEPEGDRLRGYSVLGEILAARGKKEEAELMRRIVRSVHLAEQGDALAEAGLLARSLKVYEESDKIFADAYCIRWRLAEKLYAIGDRAAAEKHYQHAFEMMPEQFGRAASLCFGCEKVFNNQRSQSTGERVLKILLEKYPRKPQVYYILGMLRSEQKRFQDAYEAFRRAVELDPEYLDAWRHLSEVADTLYLPSAERSAIALRLIQLDPLSHRYYFRENVEDYNGLWKVLEANLKLFVTPPKTLMPLPASAARLEERKKAGKIVPMDSYSIYAEEEEERRMKRPAEALADLPQLTSMLNLVGMLD